MLLGMRPADVNGAYPGIHRGTLFGAFLFQAKLFLKPHKLRDIDRSPGQPYYATQ